MRSTSRWSRAAKGRSTLMAGAMVPLARELRRAAGHEPKRSPRTGRKKKPHATSAARGGRARGGLALRHERRTRHRSEEHTSELQSPDHLVCRLLLEKKHHQRPPGGGVEAAR